MCDDYDDELPPISVNSSTRESGALSMPSAEALAAARARSAEVERSVRALHDAESSGSEGDAALAAAVAALLVRPEPAPPRAAPALAPLLRELLAAADRPALAAADDHVLEALTDHVWSAAQAGCVRSERELEVCVGWLVLAALARPAAAAHSRRAIHALLDTHRLTEESEQRVAAGVVAALRECAPAVCAAAPDVVTAARHRRLRAALLAHTLAALLHARPPQSSSCLCAWTASVAAAHCQQLSPSAARCVPRVCARLLAACGGPACGAPRAQLLQALTAQAGAPHADRLEVLVGVSKLQLLFRD